VRRLGAIISGGASRRFGSDKASALLAGRPLLDHVVSALSVQVDDIIVVGREWPGLTSVQDRPAPNFGPLGGLCAALHFGIAAGFEWVISAGCDMLPLPDFTTMIESDTPTVIEDQPLLGCWPSALATELEAHLRSTTNLSVYHWLDLIGAQQTSVDFACHNFNTQADLAAYADSLAIHPE
jgi:molybdenum cofactor guanylyltransferase